MVLLGLMPGATQYWKPSISPGEGLAYNQDEMRDLCVSLMISQGLAFQALRPQELDGRET